MITPLRGGRALPRTLVPRGEARLGPSHVTDDWALDRILPRLWGTRVCVWSDLGGV